MFYTADTRYKISNTHGVVRQVCFIPQGSWDPDRKRHYQNIYIDDIIYCFLLVIHMYVRTNTQNTYKDQVPNQQRMIPQNHTL